MVRKGSFTPGLTSGQTKGPHRADARKPFPDGSTHSASGFLLILASLVLTKLGDLLTSPKTVLSWLAASAGVPTMLIACLVPIRESGSMVPQLAIGAWLRRFPYRRPVWVFGSLAQGACMLAIAIVFMTLEGWAAGVALLALLATFSVARAFCSVTIKDIQGKAVARGQRGRLSGLASTFAGLLTVAVTVIFFLGENEPSLLLYGLLLVAAALTWFAAAAVFSHVDESPSPIVSAHFRLSDTFSNLSLLRTDPLLRRFVLARCLFLGSALAGPFLTLLAYKHGNTHWLLAGLMLASSVADTISSSIWGWIADRSSRGVMLAAGIMASTTCVFTGLIDTVFSGLSVSAWLYPAGFFALSIAHAGIRLGRSTYLVDIAEGNRRTEYVSVSNTMVGLVLLPAGAISALASLLSGGAVILLLGVAVGLGVVIAGTLPGANRA